MGARASQWPQTYTRTAPLPRAIHDRRAKNNPPSVSLVAVVPSRMVQRRDTICSACLHLPTDVESSKDPRLVRLLLFHILHAWPLELRLCVSVEVASVHVARFLSLYCLSGLWTHAAFAISLYQFTLQHVSITTAVSLQSLERIFRIHPLAQRTEAQLCELAANSLLGASDRLKMAQCSSSAVLQLTNVHQVQVGKPPEPPKSKQEREERKDDFYANLGDAIRTLREDVPTCLKAEMNCACPLYQNLCI
jgi:hypothetical protein